MSIPMPHLTEYADRWWAGCDCKTCSTPCDEVLLKPWPQAARIELHRAAAPPAKDEDEDRR